MEFYINTTDGHDVEIIISKDKKILACKKFIARYSQAEKLLPALDNLLKKNKISLSDIKRIAVANDGGSFSALRIGITTANALGYALGIPVVGMGDENSKGKPVKSEKYSVVIPKYSKEPNITIKK